MIFERLEEWIWSLENDKPPTIADVAPKLALQSLARIFGSGQGDCPQWNSRTSMNMRSVSDVVNIG